MFVNSFRLCYHIISKCDIDIYIGPIHLNYNDSSRYSQSSKTVDQSSGSLKRLHDLNRDRRMVSTRFSYLLFSLSMVTL